MPNTLLNGVLLHLRRVALQTDGGGLTDRQLLERFLTTHEEATFEALLRRHGPMVLGVCRRVLANTHDAEDAFQATFLVLVQRAASITARESLGNWLYGVAYRTAQRARTAAARRRAKEKQMARPEAQSEAGDAWRELRSVLDQELSRLPEKYRELIVLCDLEGHTRKEAARRLGCPEGTVSGRLARGRVQLAKRLARHGLALSAGAVAAAVAQNAAAAGVPLPLVSSTVKAAALLVAAGHLAAGVVSAPVAALIEGVLTTMFLSKVKWGLALAFAVGLLVTGWGICYTPAVDAPGKADGSRSAPAAGASAVQAPAVGAPRKEGEEIDLPRTPAPVQVLARIDSDGGLVIKRVGHFVRMGAGPGAIAGGGGPGPLPAPGAGGGIRVGFGGPPPGVQSQTYKLEEVEVFDTKGRKLDQKEVAERLKQETVALASLTGQKVDPLHLRLIKDGTLVFVLPLPKGGPGGALPGLPPPPGGPGLVPPEKLPGVLPNAPVPPKSEPEKL